jgi:hypothetical protein
MDQPPYGDRSGKGSPPPDQQVWRRNEMSWQVQPELDRATYGSPSLGDGEYLQQLRAARERLGARAEIAMHNPALASSLHRAGDAGNGAVRKRDFAAERLGYASVGDDLRAHPFEPRYDFKGTLIPNRRISTPAWAPTFGPKLEKLAPRTLEKLSAEEGRERSLIWRESDVVWKELQLWFDQARVLIRLTEKNSAAWERDRFRSGSTDSSVADPFTMFDFPTSSQPRADGGLLNNKPKPQFTPESAWSQERRALPSQSHTVQPSTSSPAFHVQELIPTGRPPRTPNNRDVQLKDSVESYLRGTPSRDSPHLGSDPNHHMRSAELQEYNARMQIQQLAAGVRVPKGRPPTRELEPPRLAFERPPGYSDDFTRPPPVEPVIDSSLHRAPIPSFQRDFSSNPSPRTSSPWRDREASASVYSVHPGPQNSSRSPLPPGYGRSLANSGAEAVSPASYNKPIAAAGVDTSEAVAALTKSTGTDFDYVKHISHAPPSPPPVSSGLSRPLVTEPLSMQRMQSSQFSPDTWFPGQQQRRTNPASGLHVKPAPAVSFSVTKKGGPLPVV